MNKFSFNVEEKTKLSPKYWQKCVGSGHASLGLRQDWQEQLKYVHDELGFEYVRFHGLLGDDMKVVTTLSEQMPFPGANTIQTYSFYQIGLLFDYILSIGMKPFVELAYMPTALASGKKTIFYYKINVTPPKDYQKWADLMKKFAAFLVDRYGEDEVASWYFEVWNEPDLSTFWAGKKEDYFKLYTVSANALKEVSTKIRVGGPSTSENKWIQEFREYCEQKSIPLDFLTTHNYPGDALGHDIGSFKMVMRLMKIVKASKGKDIHTVLTTMMDQEEKLQHVNRGVMKEWAKKSKEEANGLPLIYTEWNSNSGLTCYLNDDPYTSAFVTKTIIDNDGLVDGYSFWTFSDIFEELGFFHKPFSGSFGMLNIHGIPKPSFWAFKLLSKLGEERFEIPTTCESNTLEMAAFKDENAYQVLLYNQHMPLNPIEDEEVEIVLDGIDNVSDITIERVDGDHGHPKKVWVEMGEPEYLKPEELEYIKEKSKVVAEKIDYEFKDGKLVIKTVVPEQGVALIQIKK